MLCKVGFTAVDPEEDFGKSAMHVTECMTGREWQEIRVEDESMLISVLTNIRASEEQKATFLRDLK